MAVWQFDIALLPLSWIEAGGEVGVRFDMRDPNMALFRKLVDFAGASNLAIVVLATQAVLAADPHQLIRAAAESDATHFVVDPASFLMNVSAVNVKAS